MVNVLLNEGIYFIKNKNAVNFTLRMTLHKEDDLILYKIKNILFAGKNYYSKIYQVSKFEFH